MRVQIDKIVDTLKNLVIHEASDGGILEVIKAVKHVNGFSDFLVVYLHYGLESHLVHKEVTVPHADVLAALSIIGSLTLIHRASPALLLPPRPSGAPPIVQIGVVLKSTKRAEVVVLLQEVLDELVVTEGEHVLVDVEEGKEVLVVL